MRKWKSNPAVRTCSLSLFKRIRAGGKSYMHCIIDQVWPKLKIKDVPKIWLAYAITVAEIILNPETETIHIFENDVQLRMIKNQKIVVSFQRLQILNYLN